MFSIVIFNLRTNKPDLAARWRRVRCVRCFRLLRRPVNLLNARLCFDYFADRRVNERGSETGKGSRKINQANEQRCHWKINDDKRVEHVNRFMRACVLRQTIIIIKMSTTGWRASKKAQRQQQQNQQQQENNHSAGRKILLNLNLTRRKWCTSFILIVFDAVVRSLRSPLHCHFGSGNFFAINFYPVARVSVEPQR